MKRKRKSVVFVLDTAIRLGSHATKLKAFQKKEVKKDHSMKITNICFLNNKIIFATLFTTTI